MFTVKVRGFEILIYFFDIQYNAGSEEGAVARPTGVGGREPPKSLHGRIHGVLPSELPTPQQRS